jgi:hypothetical protein
MTTPPPGSVQSGTSVPLPQEGIAGAIYEDTARHANEYLTPWRYLGAEARKPYLRAADAVLAYLAARPAPPTPTQAAGTAPPPPIPERLKPCPFCRSTTVRTERADSPEPCDYWVACLRCEAIGPSQPTFTEAESSWNAYACAHEAPG